MTDGRGGGRSASPSQLPVGRRANDRGRRDNEHVPATPASTTGLSSEIQDILDTQPGARYLLADLQVHTPLDPAFEPKWDPRDAGTRELFARSYLSKA